MKSESRDVGLFSCYSVFFFFNLTDKQTSKQTNGI